ncbi:hypothetical protein ACSBR1_002022 [Camellia fascicularis]
MLKKCKIVEFDNAWARMVKQYKLENNNWVLEIHRKRDKWAEAYLRGHMFAGMRSTQRVEGMNAYFNMFLEQKVRLYEFVAQYDRALARMRVNEAETESKTENSFPVLTTPLRSLEKHAAELFTRKIFSLFRREISKEGKLFVMERVELEDRRTYHFGEYKAPTSTWTVEYFPADITIKCCCLKFESFGIPCCHMVAVMKSEQLMCIPPSCVLKRWTRRASEMSYYASQADNNFEEAREMAFQMTLKMKKLLAMRTKYNTEVGDKNIAPKLCGVGDPNIVKTKGNPGGTSSMGKPPKPRRCGYCGYGASYTRSERVKNWLQLAGERVCELDLIFNFHKAYYILDELLIAGELQESSKKTIARLITAQDSLVEAAKEQSRVVVVV